MTHSVPLKNLVENLRDVKLFQWYPGELPVEINGYTVRQSVSESFIQSCI